MFFVSHADSEFARASTRVLAFASLSVSVSALSLPATMRFSSPVICRCWASKLSKLANCAETSSMSSFVSDSKLWCSSSVRPASSCSDPMVWRSTETFSRME